MITKWEKKQFNIWLTFALMFALPTLGAFGIFVGAILGGISEFLGAIIVIPSMIVWMGSLPVGIITILVIQLKYLIKYKRSGFNKIYRKDYKIEIITDNTAISKGNR